MFKCQSRRFSSHDEQLMLLLGHCMCLQGILEFKSMMNRVIKMLVKTDAAKVEFTCLRSEGQTTSKAFRALTAVQK